MTLHTPKTPRLPSSEDFRCCGCGAAAFDGVKPCGCPTMVGARGGFSQREYVVFKTETQARRLALSNLIKTHLLGVRPDDQDLVLEDHDWMEIVAALEGAAQ
jgi:hypothetical protein